MKSYIKASPQEFIEYMKSIKKCKISKEEARKVLLKLDLLQKQVSHLILVNIGWE